MMKNFLILLVGLMVAPATLLAQPNIPAGDNTDEYSGVGGLLKNRPSTFIENRGQWPADARLLVRGEGCNLWITDEGFVYDLFRLERFGTQQENTHRKNAMGLTRRVGTVLRMTFAETSDAAEARGVGGAELYHNYFLGNDPALWAPRVPAYREARIDNLYSGVDALLRFEEGAMRYDLLVRPDADPSIVTMRYEGATGVSVDASGDLLLQTSLGEVRQRRPYAYQIVDGAERAVACSFAPRRDGAVGFSLGAYDTKRPLVIDPLIYSTVLSGGVHEAAYDMKADRAGNIYLAGWTFSPQFPVRAGAYDERFNGDSAYSDVFVTKLNSNTGEVVYSTFIGGLSGDVANAMELDTAGNIYLTGATSSSRFPYTRGAYDTTHNSAGTHDLFAAKLSRNGDSLLYATFIGGGRSDVPYGLAIDSLGNMYIGGLTYSANYPHTPLAYDTAISGSLYADAFLTKLSSDGKSILFSTFLGGDQNDQVNDLAVDSSRNVYLCGGTWSKDFPLTQNALLRSNRSTGGFERDAFVARLSPDGSTLLYSTYLGGSRHDVANAVIVDRNRNVVVCGETRSYNFPVSGPADSLNTAQKSPDLFVARIDPVVGALRASRVIGGSGEDVAYDIAVNEKGSVAICGISNSTDYPVTSNAFQPAHTDTSEFDAIFATLDSITYSPIYATYIGGAKNDYAHAIAIDGDRDIYIGGATSSIDYPTTTGPYLLAGEGAASVMVSRFSFKPASVSAEDGRRMLKSVAIAPNPVRGNVRIQVQPAAEFPLRDGASLALYNTRGEEIARAAGMMDGDGIWSAELDLSGVPTGSYYGRLAGSAEAFGPIVVAR